MVTAAQLLVAAAVQEGKWGQAIPLFGAERRGAPVVAFARISKKRLTLHSMVRKPDIVVVLDPSIMRVVDVTQGLKPGGKVVVNAKDEVNVVRGDVEIYMVDASSIARKLGLVVAGWPVVNTAMLGALARLGLVGLESVVSVVRGRWSGELAEKNVQAVIQAYESTRRVR